MEYWAWKPGILGLGIRDTGLGNPGYWAWESGILGLGIRNTS